MSVWRTFQMGPVYIYRTPADLPRYRTSHHAVRFVRTWANRLQHARPLVIDGRAYRARTRRRKP